MLFMVFAGRIGRKMKMVFAVFAVFVWKGQHLNRPGTRCFTMCLPVVFAVFAVFAVMTPTP